MGKSVFNILVKFTSDETEPLPPEVDWLNVETKNVRTILDALVVSRIKELKVTRVG